MRVKFIDQQEPTNPWNGATIETGEELARLFESVRGRQPFLAELVGDNGFTLIMGWSDTDGCVQFSSVDGEPPYLMAVGDKGYAGDEELDFLTADTATPISRRYLLPMWRVRDIAIAFFESGQRAHDVTWEEI